MMYMLVGVMAAWTAADFEVSHGIQNYLFLTSRPFNCFKQFARFDPYSLGLEPDFGILQKKFAG